MTDYFMSIPAGGTCVNTFLHSPLSCPCLFCACRSLVAVGVYKQCLASGVVPTLNILSKLLGVLKTPAPHSRQHPKALPTASKVYKASADTEHHPQQSTPVEVDPTEADPTVHSLPSLAREAPEASGAVPQATNSNRSSNVGYHPLAFALYEVCTSMGPPHYGALQTDAHMHFWDFLFTHKDKLAVNVAFHQFISNLLYFLSSSPCLVSVQEAEALNAVPVVTKGTGPLTLRLDSCPANVAEVSARLHSVM